MAPTMVLIPGSFGRSEMYDPVVLPLREKGHTIHVLEPPCYPKNYKKGTPSPSMYDDAKFIQEFVQGLADEGKDIVLMAHSYGGLPATESLKYTTKSERSSQGKPGGIIQMAYLTCIVPKVGDNLINTIKGGAPEMGVDEDGWLYQTDASVTAKLCFNSHDLEKGIALATELFLPEKHSSVCFGDALTHPGYKYVPVSWFFCEDDACILPGVQQTAINAIEESWKGTEREGQKVDVTSVKCDHIPIFSAREELEKWMEGFFTQGGGDVKSTDGTGTSVLAL